MKIVDIFYSKDKVTRKYVQMTNDNNRIETSFVDYKNKYIICFSTQVGCNMGCKFCYNGIKHNYVRNLTFEEICLQIENVLKNEKLDKDKCLLFSAMGIGEPLLNYDNLIDAFLYLDNKFPNNKFALATSGINLDNIIKLVDDLKDIKNFKLTISLHSADDTVRKSLIPVSKDVFSLVECVKKYQELSKREVEWNYVLFDGVNDSILDAKKLYDLLGDDAYIKINRFNKVDISELKASSNIQNFINTLKDLGMFVEYYETNGEDINGACGQMIS